MVNIKTKSNIIRILNNTPERHQRLDAAQYIPGDIVEQYEKRWYADGMNTEKQKREQEFYLPCSYCQATLTEIRRNGHRASCPSNNTEED